MDPRTKATTTAACDLCGGRERRLLVEKNDASYLRCEECGFVFADLPPEESIHLNESFFGSSVAEYAAKSFGAEKQRRYGRRLRMFEPYRERNRILEIGSNVGGFLNRARVDGWEGVGVEPVAACARYAREEHGLEVVAATLEEAGLEEGSFDVVYSNAVFEHLTSPSRVLSEAVRVLRPGGLAYVDTVNYASFTRRFLGRRWKLLDPRMHACLYTPETLRLLVRKAGLELVRLRSHGVRFRTGDAPRWRGLARWGEELVKLPWSAAPRLTLKGETIATLCEKPRSSG